MTPTPCAGSHRRSPAPRCTSAGPTRGPPPPGEPRAPPVYRTGVCTPNSSPGSRERDPTMRRITLWLMSTLAAVVLLFSYRTSLGGGNPTAAAAGTTAAAGGGTSGPATGGGTGTGGTTSTGGTTYEGSV